MKTVIQEMIERYPKGDLIEQRNAIKEVMQEIILYGLSTAGFFKDVALYGGTALRIFYGLDRFSEDLDFSLVIKNPHFQLSDYLPTLHSTVQSFGLDVEIQTKEKNTDYAIKSAFLKGNTIEQFLLFYPDEKIQGINNNEKIKVKFKIDIDPSAMAAFEKKFSLPPSTI